MHELGIASSILEAVEKESAQRPDVRFEKVGLRIGEMAAVDLDSLTFGWEVITKETKWEHLQLEIQTVLVRNRCGGCGLEFEVHDFDVNCPRCQTFPTFSIGGDELEIAYIEAEELEETKP